MANGIPRQKAAANITVTLNGAVRPVGAGMTVSGLLAELGLKPHGVAVERNLTIVPRACYGSTALTDQDRLEIVSFVGGG